RMEAISLFAAGAARIIADAVARARPQPAAERTSNRPESVPSKEHTEMIESGLKEVEKLAAELETIAGVRQAEVADISLNSVVRTCLNGTAFSELREAHLSISVKTELASDLLLVSGSEPQLAQALFGLVSRAMTLLPEGGTVTISTKNLHVGEGLVKYEAIPAGDYAVLWVVDDGKVVEEKSLDRVFEPFGCQDQTKADPLMLAFTYGIVKAHKGYINVKSEEGVGTEFALCIPVTRKTSGAEDREVGLPRGTESILVVDDSEPERAVAKRFLEKLGYRVSLAEAGRDAVALFKQAAGGARSPFDVMLLDMILGGELDGLDTYREIVKMFPGQKCIIASGYAPSERSYEAAELGASRFLSKPFTLEGLARAIRDELDTGV
ncbi:MAG: response regulator, partial [bacterium]